MCVGGHSWGQEIENWLPPGYRCGVMPHQDSWSVSYSGKHLAKRSFKKYGGEDGAVKELLQHAWLHAQSLDPTLACPHRSLFEKTTTAPPTALARTSSSSSSSKATVYAMGSSSSSSGFATKSSEFAAPAAGAGSSASSSKPRQDDVVLADLVLEAVAGEVDSKTPSKKRKTSSSKSSS